MRRININVVRAGSMVPVLWGKIAHEIGHVLGPGTNTQEAPCSIHPHLYGAISNKARGMVIVGRL